MGSIIVVPLGVTLGRSRSVRNQDERGRPRDPTRMRFDELPGLYVQFVGAG